MAVLRLSGEGGRQAAERVREELLRRGYSVLSGLATERELARHKLLGADPLKSPARGELGRSLKVGAALAGRVEKLRDEPLALRLELEWFDFGQDKVVWRGRAEYAGKGVLGSAFLEQTVQEAVDVTVGKLAGILPPAKPLAPGEKERPR